MNMRILLLTLILFSIGALSPSFAQEISNSFSNDIGSAYTDQREYEITYSSETIVKIHGMINDASRASKVVIIFTLPDGSKTGNHVFTTDVGEFEILFPLNSKSQQGEYNAFISHDAKIIGQLSFMVKEKPRQNPFESEPSEKDQNQTSTSPEETPTEFPEEPIEIPEDEGSYELQDGNLIYYLVTNGKLINMNIDKDTSTLYSEMNFFGEGAITIGIPRHLLDAKENNQDVEFTVYLNGNQVDYENVVTNDYDRVIMINAKEGLSQIEIIGIPTVKPIQEEPPAVELPPIITNTLRVYVSDIPTWSNNIDDTITESLNYWELQYPNLQFEQVGENEPMDFFVFWVKEFGVEHVGYAYGNKFVEVGLGDSDCRGKWTQYSPNYTGTILKHEIGHIIGLEHSSDPTSIMYPIVQNREYGLESEELVMTSGYGQYIPFCTIKDSTSYDIEITTDDPTYGFNVYVVSSEQQFQNFIDGEPIEYFKSNGCYKENTLNFDSSCNVGKGNGILLTINDKQTNNLTNIKLTLKEKSQNPHANSKFMPESKINIEQNNSSPICGTGTIEKDGVCVRAQTQATQIDVKKGQWVKYTINLNADSTNDYLKMLIESALTQEFQNSGYKLNDITWIKSEIVDVSSSQTTMQNTIHTNDSTESVYETIQDLNSLSSINFVIPTNYRIGDIVYSDVNAGDAKVTGIKTKTYGKKTFEVIEVKAEKSTNDGGNLAIYRTTQNYDKKTGMMLETLLEIKVANVLFGVVSMDLRLKAIDSYTPTPSSQGGGCLIATATYGSELAPQVQRLRELRDNSLLQTASGTSFMNIFNDFYYSFSPQIADWERESPVFKEMVKIAITPMISSLSILNYVDMDSEVSVLGYGISLIILNVGMYFVAPAVVIVGIRKRF